MRWADVPLELYIDVSKEDEMKNMVGDVAEEMGSVDIVSLPIWVRLASRV